MCAGLKQSTQFGYHFLYLSMCCWCWKPLKVWDCDQLSAVGSGKCWTSLILVSHQIWFADKIALNKQVNHICWMNSDGLNEWGYQSINLAWRVLVQIHLHHPLSWISIHYLPCQGSVSPSVKTGSPDLQWDAFYAQILRPHGQNILWDPI